MNNRESYPKINVDYFIGRLQEDLSVFKQNMDHLKMKPQSFPEWAEMLLVWMEVGTDVEEESYG